MPAYFELRTPRDVYQKAQRELARLQQEFSIDNVFNFFVTAYHIVDYVKRGAAVPKDALKRFLEDTDLKDCRDLCDKGKHLRLTQRPDPTAVIWNGSLGGAPLGALPLGGGPKWVLFSGEREIDIKWLAERVVVKWGTFLDQHGL